MEFTALRLFGFAISAALQFSLLTFIRRDRKLEKLEILFLSLIACLFCWNFGNFLLLLFEKAVSDLSKVLLDLVVAPLAFGVLAFLPPLLLHVHIAFQSRVLPKPLFPTSRVLEWALYLPLIALPFAIADFLPNYNASKSILVTSHFSQAYAAWFSFALAVSAFFEWRMRRESRKREDRALFTILSILFLAVMGLVVYTYFIIDPDSLEAGGLLETVLMLWSVVPSALLGYFVFRHNFLEIAIQRSFGYPFAAVLLLLVYLISVRYIPDYFSYVPKEVIQAGMIIFLLPLLQPLRRWIDHSIDGLFSREITRFEKLASSLDEISHATVDLDQLLRLTEDRLRTGLNIKAIHLRVKGEPNDAGDNLPDRTPNHERIPLQKGEVPVGEMLVEGHTANLAGEQHAALRFVIPQIVAAIETCRLVEGKIQLERELAERSRLASLGQMAATVAHNIKNPLSSIKTIVQLMQEDTDLDTRYGQDLSVIKSEIDRLTESVTQLLRFSKPTVASSKVEVAAVLEKTILIFRPDADRRNIALRLDLSEKPLWVRGSEEVLLEIFQNLLVNALEVSKQHEAVVVRATQRAAQRRVVVQVEDEGPGVPEEIRSKIFMPFFTTKQKGTGLGLAVVQRRVMDLGGEVSCLSPISPKGGTRFEVTLPPVDA